MSDLSKLNVQTLLTYRANAAKTGLSCIGHSKLFRNENLFGAYTSELHTRGFTEYETGWSGLIKAAESGVFNGQGSS